MPNPHCKGNPGWQKGVSGNPKGMPKGTKHRTTYALKNCFLGAFEELGGQEELVAFAKKSDANYLEIVKMIARLLPREITGPEGGDLMVVIKKARENA